MVLSSLFHTSLSPNLTPDRHTRPLNPLRILAASALPLLLLSTTLHGTNAQDDDDDEPTSSTAQVTAPFIDPLTTLPMELFFGARTQFGFAMALPLTSTTSTSFIGQLSFPLVAGSGWGAMGLTGDMDGNFILAAWPDGAGGVMSSFRQASDEDNPPEVRGRFRVRPIAEGVAISNTQLTYTFLCEECLNSTLGLGPEATVANAVMGWALSERAPRGNPADPGAGLGFHERGFGPFTARLGEARTEGFEAVAARAGLPVADSGRAIEASVNIFDGDGDSDSEGEGDDGDDGGVGRGVAGAGQVGGGGGGGGAAAAAGAGQVGGAAAGGAVGGAGQVGAGAGVVAGGAAQGVAVGGGNSAGTGSGGAGAGAGAGNAVGGGGGDDSDSDDDD